MPDTQAESTVAILGLGIMGSALAKHLVAGGFNVRGYDPDVAARDQASELGVTVVSGAAEAAQGAGFVLSSLPSEMALISTAMALVNGAGDLDVKPIIVELSTLSIDSKLSARDQLLEVGVDMLDCPISGTGAQAQTKDIVLYASGQKDVFGQCQAVFDAVARESVYLGAFGNGMRMKFVANLLVAVHNVASAEALALAKQAGLDPQQVFDVISSGAGNSRIFELRGPMMVQEKYTPATMKLDVWQKDMGLIQEFAEGLGAMTPVFNATKPLYDRANEAGLGKEDTAAVLEVLKRTH